MSRFRTATHFGKPAGGWLAKCSAPRRPTSSAANQTKTTERRGRAFSVAAARATSRRVAAPEALSSAPGLTRGQSPMWSRCAPTTTYSPFKDGSEPGRTATTLCVVTSRHGRPFTARRLTAVPEGDHPLRQDLLRSATVSFFPARSLSAKASLTIASGRSRLMPTFVEVTGLSTRRSPAAPFRARGAGPGDRGAVLFPLAGFRLPAQDQDDLPLHVDAGVVVAALGRGVEAVPDEADLGGDVPGTSRSPSGTSPSGPPPRRASPPSRPRQEGA